jgi:hypothetical protein
MRDVGIDAVGVTDDTHFVGNARVIAKLASDNRLPSIGFSEFAPAGGLIGYGVNLGARTSLAKVAAFLSGAPGLSSGPFRPKEADDFQRELEVTSWGRRSGWCRLS